MLVGGLGVARALRRQHFGHLARSGHVLSFDQDSGNELTQIHVYTYIYIYICDICMCVYIYIYIYKVRACRERRNSTQPSACISPLEPLAYPNNDDNNHDSNNDNNNDDNNNDNNMNNMNNDNNNNSSTQHAACASPLELLVAECALHTVASTIARSSRWGLNFYGAEIISLSLSLSIHIYIYIPGYVYIYI